MPPKKFPVAPALRRMKRAAMPPPSAAQTSIEGKIPKLSDPAVSKAPEESSGLSVKAFAQHLTLLKAAASKDQDGRKYFPILMERLTENPELIPKFSTVAPPEETHRYAKAFIQAALESQDPKPGLSVAAKFLRINALEKGYDPSTVELYRLSQARSGPTQKVNTGLSAYEESTISKRVHQLAAEKDYFAALYAARAHLKQGKKAEAMGYFKLASQSDHPENTGEAALFVGTFYHEKGDKKTAWEWYDRSAKKGCPGGLRNRAVATSQAADGTGNHPFIPFSSSAPTFPTLEDVDSPATLIVRDLLKAAANGDSGAPRILQVCYHQLATQTGEWEGSEESLKVSEEWNLLAAENEQMEAVAQKLEDSRRGGS